MKLCIGAVSRRVVQEAAKLQVEQIVASRRQVDAKGGYTGITSIELVEMVKRLSHGRTQVVRDHGGPYQAGLEDEDAWLADFDDCVESGFDGLHLDVCKLDRDEQLVELRRLLARYGNIVSIEVGGERDEQSWLDRLVKETLDHGVTPSYAVVDVGGHAHADRQCGTPRDPRDIAVTTNTLNDFGIRSKAHNMDWMGRRQRYEGVLDAMNIAPEYAQVELDAILYMCKPKKVRKLLARAQQIDVPAAQRWFDEGEGTTIERTRCKLRYLMKVLPFFDEVIDDEADMFVRGAIRDAISSG
jgi:hypothetical protein